MSPNNESHRGISELLGEAGDRVPKTVEPFGLVSPAGFRDWKTIDEFELIVDGLSRTLTVHFEIGDPESPQQVANYRLIHARLGELMEGLLQLQLEFVENEPDEFSAEDWSTVSISIVITEAAIDDATKWSATADGGPVAGEWNLFLEGMELKAILPDWDDPEAHGLSGYYE